MVIYGYDDSVSNQICALDKYPVVIDFDRIEPC